MSPLIHFVSPVTVVCVHMYVYMDMPRASPNRMKMDEEEIENEFNISAHVMHGNLELIISTMPSASKSNIIFIINSISNID